MRTVGEKKYSEFDITLWGITVFKQGHTLIKPDNLFYFQV